MARWWHRGVHCCLAAVSGEGVGGVGGGVGDELAAAAVLAVGLEGGDWHVRLRPYLSLCKKCSGEHFFLLPGALFCSQECSLLSTPYCSPSCKQNIPSINIMPTSLGYRQLYEFLQVDWAKYLSYS